MALAGDTLAVGADLEDSNATGIGGDQTDNSAFASGAVYVRRIAPYPDLTERPADAREMLGDGRQHTLVRLAAVGYRADMRRARSRGLASAPRRAGR